MFVVDVQERFRPHIAGFDDMVSSIRMLLRACALLDVPVAFSEQYPEGLGATVPELLELLDDASRFEKSEISACAAPGFDALPPRIADAATMLVVGIETHVCVSQTVHDLMHRGRRVHIAADAVGSRDPWQREVALERLARAGATVTTVEAALFELLECAGTERFTAVQRLIKQRDAEVRERRGELEVSA